MIHRLHNPVRPYAWGSRTHIAGLTSREFGDQPVAEMWIGAHPSAPSRLGDDQGERLDDVIAAAPARTLGSYAQALHGDRLPYLLKLLAASEPLSLQVHPEAERAQRGFNAQEAAGMATDAWDRSYPDPSHKPELLHALTRFEGLAGFRDTGKTAAILRGLRLPWLDRDAGFLDNHHDAEQAVSELVTGWMSLPEDDVKRLLADVGAAAMSAEQRAHSAARPHRPTAMDAAEIARESVRVFAATAALVERYPTDPGVLVTLLLNHVVLAPGESMFIEAGVVHAYTAGFGIEIMASSDNVLRAGLTRKHVDVPELLAAASFQPIPPPRYVGTRVGADTVLAPPVAEFELHLLDLDGSAVTLGHPAPRVVLCLRDKVELSAGGEGLTLDQGEAAFVEAISGELTLCGPGRAVVAQTPVAAR
jgi:mannose-6-phosphate isomerase